MDTTQYISVYGTIIIFLFSIVILLFGGLIINISPSVKQLKHHQIYLSGIILKYRFLSKFKNETVKKFSISSIDKTLLEHKTDTTLLNKYDGLPIAKIIEIVNYPQKDIDNITSSIRSYAFVLAIGTIITFLISLPKGQESITYDYVLNTLSQSPFKVLALTDLFALIFIFHKYYLELKKISDLINLS